MTSTLESRLLPEVLLTPWHGEAWEVASQQAPLLQSDDPAYRNYLVLTWLPGRLPAEWQSGASLLINRYYWFRRFVHQRQRQQGPDAGLEQMAFQILAEATEEVDWALVEEVDAQA